MTVLDVQRLPKPGTTGKVGWYNGTRKNTETRSIRREIDEKCGVYEGGPCPGIVYDRKDEFNVSGW